MEDRRFIEGLDEARREFGLALEAARGGRFREVDRHLDYCEGSLGVVMAEITVARASVSLRGRRCTARPALTRRWSC